MTTYTKLPASLREIAEHIGTEAAVKLSEELGGQHFSTPADGNISEGHPIAKAIGVDRANKLARTFRANRIEIPIFARKLKRNAEIRRAHANGESISALVVRFCMAERQLRRILKQK